MKTSLEYKGQAVTPDWKIPKGEMLSICARCDPDKTLAQSLTKAGYKITHGVCDKHKAEWLKKMNHQ